MAKNKGRARDTAVEPKTAPERPKIVKAWEKYFGAGDLADWQRLMRDLGSTKEFKSKKGVWVNIRDFLDAIDLGSTIEHLPSQQALAEYTIASHKLYPRKAIPKGSPLLGLLAHIFCPRIQGYKSVYVDEVTQLFGGFSINEEVLVGRAAR
ncbi:hypothetical protein BJ170DRAFT_685235 [Xylariales sp. AK1849]|nr:hypothetical protein BJ170DRAFT_685235 [Xylariales sp. AK1849]